MIRRQHKAFKSRRGASAVVMVVVMLLVTVMVMGMVVSGGRDQDLTVRRVETIQAFYAAESGMNMAIREMMENADEDGDGTVGSISDDGDSGTDPRVGNAAVVVTIDDGGSTSILSSRGSWGAAERVIQADLVGSSGGASGWSAKYFDVGYSLSQLSDWNWATTPTATGIVDEINYPAVPDSGNPLWTGGPATRYAAEFNANIEIPTSGSWTFYTYSDDGSKLWINGVEVVNNDYPHGSRERQGTLTLSAGSHSIRVRFFENAGWHSLIARWSGPGTPKAVIPVDVVSN